MPFLCPTCNCDAGCPSDIKETSSLELPESKFREVTKRCTLCEYVWTEIWKMVDMYEGESKMAKRLGEELLKSFP